MIVIGTAGHIDHGKTSLVGALTGIKTDRLKEEQERGISIELGFAYMDLADGRRCGLVDVPGHERFVRQMIAGASGIDLVILVVAADEGVMQQTREHLDICRLLGIRRGMVVLSKVDLVDEEWLELVESDLSEFLEDTFLEGAPVVHFSAVTEGAVEPVRAQIAAIANELDQEGNASVGRPLRHAIDRVFSMKGFGTVITGTVSSGKLQVGDSVELLPSGERAKVRGIESHKESVKAVEAGQRAAVNLQGVERSAVSRGDVLTHAGSLTPTRMLDIDLTLLAHVPKPLKTRAKGLVHVGTSQVNGTLVLLDRAELEPGETAPAQLRLDEFVVALGGDHVVIRGFDLLPTYGKTLGGGVIRHPNPRRHKRDNPTVLKALEALRGTDVTAMVEQTVRITDHVGVGPAAVHQTVNATRAAVEKTLEQLRSEQRLFRYVQDGAPVFIHATPFGEMVERARTTLRDYHERYAHRAGIPREELRSQIRSELPSRYFAEILDFMQSGGEAETDGKQVWLVGFAPTLTPALEKLKSAIEARFDRGAMEPPAPADVVSEMAAEHQVDKVDVTEMIELLVKEAKLTRVQESLVFGARHIAHVEREVVAFLEKNGEMTTPQLKEITGTSRKYTVPLGEFLDARKVTIRVGDVRKLRGQ